MFKLKNHLTLIILFFYTSAFAEIVTDFKVVGNDRVSKNTIINFTEIDKGDDVSSRELNNSLKKIYSPSFKSMIKKEKSPYGNGGASVRIVEILKKIKTDNLFQKKFYNIR